MSANRRSQRTYASNINFNCREYYRFQRAQGGAVAVRAKASFILVQFFFIFFVIGMGVIVMSPLVDGTILLVVGGVLVILSMLSGLLLVGLFSFDYRNYKINYWNRLNEQLRANATNPNQPTTFPIQSTTNPVQPISGLYQSDTYPPQPKPYPLQPTSYPLQPTSYPPQPTAYPPQTAAYPPQTTAYTPQPTAYPPQPTAYPPQTTAYQAGPQPTAAQSSLPPSYAEVAALPPTHHEPPHEFGYPPAGALPEKGTLPMEDTPNALDSQQPSAPAPL